MVPKLELLISVYQVNSNSAPDFIDAGVPGFGFLLPSHKPAPVGATDASTDDGPEASVVAKNAAADAKRKADPPRTLALSSMVKTINTTTVRTSIYTTGPDNAQKDGIDLLKVGMVVEVTGVVANVGGDGKTLWLNASRVTPLRSEAPATGAEVSTMINELGRDKPALAAALFASQACGGFFNGGFDSTPAKDVQADVFRNAWAGVVDTTAKNCDVLATNLKSTSADDDKNVQILTDHCRRIKNLSPAQVASGDAMIFMPDRMVTEDRPLFCAPLIQMGRHPQFPQPSALLDLADGTLEKLPKTFCSLDVQSVEHQGATLNLKSRLWCVGDRDAAAAAFKAGTNPILSSGKHACVGIKLNMREFCSQLGSTVKAKAEMAAEELLPFADFVALARVSPKPYGDDGVRVTFAESFVVDMPSAIQRVAMPVSEAWVVANLAGGNSQFVYEPDDTLKRIQDAQHKDVSIALPALKLNGYQPISESSFKFSSKTPSDKPVKNYYVLFQGCAEIAGGDDDLTTAFGEKTVVATAEANDLEVTEFMTTHSIVYCVATTA